MYLWMWWYLVVIAKCISHRDERGCKWFWDVQLWEMTSRSWYFCLADNLKCSILSFPHYPGTYSLSPKQVLCITICSGDAVQSEEKLGYKISLTAANDWHHKILQISRPASAFSYEYEVITNYFSLSRGSPHLNFTACSTSILDLRNDHAFSSMTS